MHKNIKFILFFFYQLLSASSHQSQIELLCPIDSQYYNRYPMPQSGFLENGSILVSGEKSQHVHSRVRFQVLNNILMLFYPMVPGVENCFLYDQKLSPLVRFNNVISQVGDCLIQSNFDGIRQLFLVFKITSGAQFREPIVFNAEQMFKLSDNRAVFINRSPEPTVYTVDTDLLQAFHVESKADEKSLLFKIDGAFYMFHFDGREYKILNNGLPLAVLPKTSFDKINLEKGVFYRAVEMDEYMQCTVAELDLISGQEVPNSRTRMWRALFETRKFG